MTRRECLKIVGGGMAGLMLGGARALGQAKPSRPNVIFLMTDQQRWDALGVHNPHVKTPNLDRLARRGIVYRQAVCQAPICVPSRNSLMLGLYPSQLGVRNNSGGLADESRLPTAPLPELMLRAGYQTAGFGKTHWGNGKINADATTRTAAEPPTRGFEIRAVPSGPGLSAERGALLRTEDDPEGVAQAKAVGRVSDFGMGGEGVNGYIGLTSRLPRHAHADDWNARQCLKFLDSGKVDPDRPLFLYLSFMGPHAPLCPPREFEDLYDIDQIPDIPQPPWESEPESHQRALDRTSEFVGGRYSEWRAAWSKMTPLERRRTTLRYWALCSWLDDYIGQVLDRLEKLGRLENALIVFTSDHGEMLGERLHRFSKYCLYDSSVRVPLILAGSCVPESKRGTMDDRPAELVDLVPTITKFIGQPANPILPGLDLLGDARRIGAFSEMHGSGFELPQPAPAYMWRKQDWKLILYLSGTIEDAVLRTDRHEGELYHLAEDPHEWNNLYHDEKYAAVREKMKTELLLHLACAWSRGPVLSETGRGG